MSVSNKQEVSCLGARGCVNKAVARCGFLQSRLLSMSYSGGEERESWASWLEDVNERTSAKEQKKRSKNEGEREDCWEKSDWT